jgi:hypothetical protein
MEMEMEMETETETEKGMRHYTSSDTGPSLFVTIHVGVAALPETALPL